MNYLRSQHIFHRNNSIYIYHFYTQFFSVATFYTIAVSYLLNQTFFDHHSSMIERALFERKE